MKTPKALPAVLAAALLAVLLAGGLGKLSADPPLVYDSACTDRLSPDVEETVLSYSRGPYSPRLPLVPLWVSVTPAEPGDRAAWTIHYGLGTVGMTLDGEGIPSICKPLR